MSIIFNDRIGPGGPEEFEMRGEPNAFDDELIHEFTKEEIDQQKVIWLIRRGASINARTMGGGWTAAAIASFNLNAQGIMLAYRLGADLTVKTDKGNTLTMLAEFNRDCKGIVKLLRRLGAK
jgi:hypothetical protein